MTKEYGLKPPPPQDVAGVILYHERTQIDDRIREVKRLHDCGHDVSAIQQEIGVSRRQTFNYLRQIDLATKAYVIAFPHEFSRDVEALKKAIFRRRDLDRMLRRELATDPNLSKDIAIYKLVLQNLRELEELLGLRVKRIEHQGELTVKDSIQALLDKAPAVVRDQYLDALDSLLATAEE
jgi:hypothetical protein